MYNIINFATELQMHYRCITDTLQMHCRCITVIRVLKFSALDNIGTKSKSWQFLISVWSRLRPYYIKCQDLCVLQNWECYAIGAFTLFI